MDRARRPSRRPAILYETADLEKQSKRRTGRGRDKESEKGDAFIYVVVMRRYGGREMEKKNSKEKKIVKVKKCGMTETSN